MLSSSGNNKLKSGKGPEKNDSPDRNESIQDSTSDGKVRGYVETYDGPSSFGGPQRDGRFRSRGRVTEYRPSRGSGQGRGRGGFPPRGDRELSDVSYQFRDSLTHSTSDNWNSTNNTNKFFERSELAVSLPEDPRISKLLRRLCAEVDVERSLVIAGKLQDAVLMPENTRYIWRSYDILVESLLDIFYVAAGPETKENAAIVLGRIGYVMGQEYYKHLDWIMATYGAHNSTVKHLLITSLVETFQLDFQNLKLVTFADTTLAKLQTIIEITDSADVFIAAINAMIVISNSYPEHFANHFVDTVDILVGWHVDNAQPKKIKDFAVQSLYKLSRHWQADVGFSVNLLNQFIEDMVAYSSDLEPSVDNDDIESGSHEDSIQKITSFLNVFNTVIKSLGPLLNPSVSQTISWGFLTDSLTKILQVMEKTLSEDTESDLILVGNECIVLLLECLKTKATCSTTMLFSLITKEMINYLQMEEIVILSIINLIAKTIKEISSNLHIDFITQIVGPKSLLKPLRYYESYNVLHGAMSIYSNLLNLKNIPLLQETYKFVLSDIHNSYSLFLPEISIIQVDYTEDISNYDDAEKNVIFYLQCLSELANASNSIIGMWALKPSILELLAIKMCPHDDNLIRQRPALQYSILYLLYSHSKKNNYFIASSDMVKNTQQRCNDVFGLANLSIGDVSSPTSGHLYIILNLISLVLEKDIPKETLRFLLNWITDIFIQLNKYIHIISVSKTFLVLVSNILTLAHTFDDSIAVLILNICQLLVANKGLVCNVLILKNIANICILHIDNTNKILSNVSINVLSELPWDIVQLEIEKQVIKVFATRRSNMVNLDVDNKIGAFKEYLMKGSYTSLSNHHFKMMMNNLLQITLERRTILANSFTSSWPLQCQENDDINILFFRQCANHFSSVCIGWGLSELANTCVTLKLRTILGKPQEIFMKIEGALKNIARETSSHETKYIGNEDIMLTDLIISEEVRSRWLIEFMTFLEKYIYNAAEGTAVVLPAVPKPVKTFFKTNWPTCRDWFTRVRPAALAVSLYSGNFGATIYHASLILQTAALTDSNIDIEAITISVAKALIKLQEPEVLHGLYVWIHQTFDKNFVWLKGAAEQANSRHELSIDLYMNLLNNDNDDVTESGDMSKKEQRNIKFIDEQVMESYKHIQCWEEMQSWKEKGDHKKHNSSWDSFCALRKFDDNMDFTKELSEWDILNFDSNEISKSSCSYQNLINQIESTLVYTASHLYYHCDNEKYQNILDKCDVMLKSSSEEFIRTNAIHFLKDIMILQQATNGLKNILANGKGIPNPFRPSSLKEHKYDTELERLSRILWWNQYFTKLNFTEENAYFTECLRLDVIKSARKSVNVATAKRELLKHFKQNSAFQFCIGNIYNIEEMSDLLLQSNAYELDIWSLNNTTALTELCKLTYAKEETKTKAINLCACISLGLSQRLAVGEQSYELKEKGTRLLLTLSKWVQNENESILEVESPLMKLILALPEIGLVDNNVSENVIPLTDSAVGKLLQFGVNQCPGLAKAWSNFATWCFRWGRKMVEYGSKTREQLTDHDKIQIENVMIGCSPQDFDAVCDILSKTKATCEDDDIDWSEINTSEMIENQLRTVPSLSNAYPEHLALLVDIWRQAQKRVFSYFELSADAYFKFLQLICASDFINHSGENAVVNATLRLLRLIVKHAMELQAVLELGLANTPTQPWKVIIPQLFSRLNHPETYVRKCVSDLLCRLAEDTPHLITFPAVVGAVENERKRFPELNTKTPFLLNGEESDDNVASDLDEGSSEILMNNELNSCFLDMVDTLSNQAPRTILQVKLLVKELQRINLLWDELWLGTLAQHHTEFTKRFSQLEIEVAKVKNNANLSEDEKVKLIKEKHRIILDPVVYVLEQLNSVTSSPPETPHEKYFQNKFLLTINEVIDKLVNPTNPEKPQESYAPLKQFQIKLQQKVSKRTSYVLKMADISPILAELRNTVITMPGLHTYQRTVRITINSIENNVVILPTKTKPKKLVFYGSDGKSYTYLFKGLEDLHLDERIMQLLSITNTMLARNFENNDNQTYRARHYSVIPLGPRSGLISWVDNVTPLFALYKRWQNREAAILSAKTNKTVTVLRPSELFYSKLNPLLKEAGVSSENRKEWPVSVLKQVLQELTSETPRDLLWRELWCSSVTPEQWWQMTRRYSYSVAVMSIIGYIIGLGDRHLDNVLVDLTSGEVVHIDYNVCFEKGKTLRVPEKVPFRLTPNLVTALGVTGVEGIFRLACEHVYRTMRRGRETLLTLLEAFVYDPLVEWGAGAGGAEGSAGTRRTRSARDLQAALAMLQVRLQEHAKEIDDNTEQFLKILPDVQKHAEKWQEENEELKSVETKLQECHQQMALIKEIEAYGSNLANHPLYAISQKYATYKQAKNAVEDSIKALNKILNDFDIQSENYASAIEIINGPQLMVWLKEFSEPDDTDQFPIFEHLKEFLINAGQSTLFTHCEQAELELNQCLKQTHRLVRACLELLARYAAAYQYFPQTHTEYHRIVMFRKWLATALESKSPEVCREVSVQVTALVNSDVSNADAQQQQQIVAYNYRLHSLLAEAKMNLGKAIEAIQIEGGIENLSATQEAYREAKTNISNWIRNEEGASSALESVVISSLCNLNRRYLMLESGAQSAGDCLVDLKSREGVWFLDDMHDLSLQAVELVSLLPSQSSSTEDPSLPVAIECVRTANLLISDLVQLNYNFSTILLPEIMKKLHSEDASCLLMINELNSIIMSTPMSLNELLAQLEMHFRYLAMDMESSGSGAVAAVSSLRARLEELTAEGEGAFAWARAAMAALGAGEARARALAAAVTPAPRPDWRKADQVSEALHMHAGMQSPALRAVLEDEMFVARVQALAEVLAGCAQTALAFKARGPPALHDCAALCKPVRRYIATFVQRCVAGGPSLAVACVLCGCCTARGASLPTRELGASWRLSLEAACEALPPGSPALRSAGAALASAAVSARRSAGAAARREQARAAWAADVAGLAARADAHAVLHRVASAGAGELAGGVLALSRELAAAAERLGGAQARAQPLVAQAHQRAKWGVGANPALAALVLRLEERWAGAAGRSQRALGVARRVALGAGAARPLPHARSARTITQALAHWEKACTLSAKYSLNVSAVEESLMEMLHPEGNIDAQWVTNVAGVVREMTAQLSASVSARRASAQAAQAAARAAARALDAPDEQRRRLLRDLMPSLLALRGAAQAESLVADFVEAHVPRTAALLAATREGDAGAADELRRHLPDFKARAHRIAAEWVAESGGGRRGARLQAGGEAGGGAGAGVWRRVRLKLEAKRPAAAQVDSLIEEATGSDKLCLMYEGWMAWV